MNIKSSSPSKRHRRGFTLVELMMVVGLMLLVLKLMLPSLKGLMGGTVGSAARYQLIGGLNSARTMALQNGFPVYMVFMPLFSEVGGDSDDRDAYLGVEGNSMLAEQSISYAIYAEYLPGDQPTDPSKQWLTDWKRLPAGFYFAAEDLAKIRDSANASGEENILKFNNLKNGHSRGSPDEFENFVERKMRLPYLMYNSRGEMAARGKPGEVRGRDCFFKLTEGGVLPARDVNGTYSLEDADREDPLVAEKKKHVWLSINGFTGRAGGLAEGPVEEKLYEMRVHSLSKDPLEVADEMADWLDENNLPASDRAWAGSGMWGNRDTLGNRIWTGGIGGIERPAAVEGISLTELMRLNAHLRRIDPDIQLRVNVIKDLEDQ